MRSVSVVIPTVGRAELAQAIASVEAQTVPPLEVLVVADRENVRVPASSLPVTLITSTIGSGANAARQAGVEAAKGELIALLDDDDVWLPFKLKRQLEAIEAANPADDAWLASSLLYVSFLRGTDSISRAREIIPTITYTSDVTVAQYLLRKTAFRGGTGFAGAQTSSLIFPRSLAVRVPFDTTLPFFQDSAWVVDLNVAEPNLRMFQVREPLLMYTTTDGGTSSRINAANSIEWGLERLRALDPRSRGDFLLTVPVFCARRDDSPRGVLLAMRAAAVNGRPGLPAWAYAFRCLLTTVCSLPRRWLN